MKFSIKATVARSTDFVCNIGLVYKGFKVNTNNVTTFFKAKAK